MALRGAAFAEVPLCPSQGLTTISGTVHDFSCNAWSKTTGRRPQPSECVACHVSTQPSNWVHTLSSVTYTPYYSSGNQPGPRSKLCLSCHDGTVAIDNFAGNTLPSSSGFISATNQIGGNGSLKNDHPIGLLYNSAMASADSSLYDPATKTVTFNDPKNGPITGSIANMMLFDGTTSGGQMECSTCHDVHNYLGTVKLLKVTTAGSAICLTCHNK
jgi:predicted CXXCH cytochrome family protein